MRITIKYILYTYYILLRVKIWYHYDIFRSFHETWSLIDMNDGIEIPERIEFQLWQTCIDFVQMSHIQEAPEDVKSTLVVYKN